MLFYLVSLVVIFIDQLSKWAIVNYMKLYESIPIIDGWLHITSSRNRGAAFGILQNQRWFFVLLTSVVVIFLIYYIYRVYKQHKLYSLALSMVLGGAIGNFIDRVAIGEVVDFIDVRIINFAIFNLADSAIVIGVGLIILDMIISKDSDKYFA